MSKTSRISVSIGVLVLAFLLGRHMRPDPVVIEKPVEHVTTVEVPKVTEKIVTQYVPVADKAQAAALLKENEQLRLQVQQLSVSLAAAQSTTSGPAVVEVPPCPVVSTTPPSPVRVSYSDYRLSFQSVDNTATYTLSQKFSIVNSVGKTTTGTPTNLVRLYEIGPGETRTLIPTTETTTIASMPQAHLYAHGTLAAGVLLLPVSTTPGTTIRTGGAVALTWLKHGASYAPEDTRYAFLSPAFVFTSTEKLVGVLPISMNLGTLPRQPFTNLWISPFLGVSPTAIKLSRFAIVFSAGF